MLSKKIKTMLSATAAIRDALINTEVEDIVLGFLHGSAKADECDRLISKTNAIEATLNAAAKNEFVAQAAFAQSEAELANAIANYSAGKKYIPLWQDAIGAKDLKFPRLNAIGERFFFSGENITVGEYLEITGIDKQTARRKKVA